MPRTTGRIHPTTCFRQVTILILLVHVAALLPLAQGWMPVISARHRCHSPASQQHQQQLMMAQVSRIESTPNPSCFLVQLSAPLDGLEDMEGSLKGRTYAASEITTTGETPTEIADILVIDGMDSVYAMASALTINKKAAAKWDVILPLVLKALGAENNEEILQGLLASTSASSSSGQESGTSSGQVTIRLQISNNMPIQIEGIGYLGTTMRKKLAPKFAQSMESLVEGGCNFFADRKWVDRGVRYIDTIDAESGEVAMVEDNEENVELTTVLDAEFEEFDAAYSEARLAAIVAKQLRQDVPPISPPDTTTLTMDLESVDQFCDLADAGDEKALQVLAEFVKSHNGNMAARRNALAYLGGTGLEFPGNELAFGAVVSALKNEKNPIMRRTAGDALSDLGDKLAVPHAIEALADRSKLVQWRAARILGELGDSMDTTAVLKQASFSSAYAFEVTFEIKDAMRKVRERALNKDAGITGGPATGPIWKQIQDGMTEKSTNNE